MWAFSRLRVLNVPLIDAISAASLSMMQQFKSQHLSATAWSLAFLRYQDEQLVNAIADTATKRISEVGTQELSNFVWSFALLSVRKPPFMQAICGRAIEQISEFEQIALTNIAWAFARLADINQQLLEAIAGQACSIIDTIDTQAAARMLDAQVPSKVLSVRLEEDLKRFCKALPETSEGWQEASPDLLKSAITADNVAITGTQKLLDVWNITSNDNYLGEQAVRAAETSNTFALDELHHIERGSAWAYLEWKVIDRLEEVIESGFEVGTTAQRWTSEIEVSEATAWWKEVTPLRAFSLAVKDRVQRAACAESRHIQV
jgi:hypothetical protein